MWRFEYHPGPFPARPVYAALRRSVRLSTLCWSRPERCSARVHPRRGHLRTCSAKGIEQMMITPDEQAEAVHLAAFHGDRVYQAVADALQAALREGDGGRIERYSRITTFLNHKRYR